MKLYSQAPFFRFIIPFILGILTAIYLPSQIPAFDFLILALFVTLIFLFSFKVFALAYKWRWLGGLVITVLFYLLGYQFTIIKTDAFNKQHFGKNTNPVKNYFVTVTTSPEEKEKSIKVNVTVLALKQGNAWKSCMGKALIYFKKDSLSKNIKYGDALFLSSHFNEINPPQNPGEFDYKKHLAYHNIYHQAYVNENEWFFSNINNANFLIQYALSLREKLLTIFKSNGIEGTELAVSSALILGYDDTLDADTIRSYAATGAMHVLSVSGLHVAIVYVIFNWLLSFLDKLKGGRIIKSVALILLIWFYALLTGFSPSVLRATTMFSFIILGKSWNRYTNIYNTLAASCFLLLLIDPYVIMNLGFQLSYLAVLGIVLIQANIYNWWEPHTWLMDQIWKMTTVSIAAQLATFPLGLLYFHQFPNYFLLSNLVVIPLSTLILYTGMLLFIVSEITVLATWVALILKYAVFFLNKSVAIIENLPFSILEGISMSVTTTYAIYLILILLFLFLHDKHLAYFKSLLLAVILLLILQNVELLAQEHHKNIVVYQVPHHSAYDFINGKTHLFYADSALINNENSMRFHIKNNWWNWGLNKHLIIADKQPYCKEKDVYLKKNYIQFLDKKIVVISSRLQLQHTKKMKINYLILANNANCKVVDVISKFDFDQLIIDSSNSHWKADEWIKEAKQLTINCYSVVHSGAMQLKL